MRKFRVILLAAAVTVGMFSCKPDPKLLEQARKEGIKIGYDSAMQWHQKSMDSIVLFSPNFKLFEDPRTYVHTHTEKLAKSLRNSAVVESGVLTVVEATGHDHPGNSHAVVERIPFINTTNLSAAQLEKVMLDASAHGHTLTYKTTVIELTTPVRAKVIVAYDLKVQ